MGRAFLDCGKTVRYEYHHEPPARNLQTVNRGNQTAVMERWQLTYLKNTLNVPSLKRIPYHLRTIWLFTASDFKVLVGSCTMFGVSSAVANSVFDRETLPLAFVLGRTPMVAFWLWTMLLPFNIGNQRRFNAIQEDRINKPWRPMPSNRIQPSPVGKVLLLSYVLAIGVSFCLGGMWQCLALIGLDYSYNDLGGGDRSFLMRNLLNGCAFLCYNSGALEIALGATSESIYNPTTWRWLMMTSAIVISTIHTQDLADQAGDKLTKRSTLPVMVGDKTSRWLVGIPVALWAYAVCTFWELDVGRCLPLLLVDGVLVIRVLCKTSVSDDVITWKVWAGWMITIYLVPLIKIV